MKCFGCFKGFTLAEVLITLAVIGIIAAITIPSLLANHQKRTLETQFAKAYRTLSTAVQLAVAEHGEISTWDWKNAEGSMSMEEQDAFVKKYFLPHLNVMKFCPADNSVNGCFLNKMFLRPDGSNWINPDTVPWAQVVLADGMAINFAVINNFYEKRVYAMTFDIDINGNKKPNTLGRDIFFFALYPQTNEFVPYGINGAYDVETGTMIKLTEEEMAQNCLNGRGETCAALIVADGFKMNY